MAMTWYDAYGRKVEVSALKDQQGGPSVRGVRQRDALHPAAGLTPGRLAQILSNSILSSPDDYLALAEDMEERDLHYASVLQTRKLQVAGLEITVEAAGDDGASIQHADLVRSVVERDEFEVELRDILDATGKGFSCTEIIWDTSERQWMPKRLVWNDARWFEFDRADGETPMLRGDNGPEPLKPYGWIFHSFKAKSGLPIRGGLARAAAWAFLFKSFTMKDWAIFSEAYGQPLRLGKYGPGATEPDKDVLLQAVANIGADYAAIVPASMAVEFVEANISGSHELYEKRADWLDRQVSKLVLGQTSTTDAQKGSYAVGKVHDGVRDDIEKADAKALAATLNRDLVRPLVSLNFGPQKKWPKIKIGRPDEEDVDKLVENVDRLVPRGLKVGMTWMRDKLGIPDPGDEEELLGSAPAADKDAAAPPTDAMNKAAAETGEAIKAALAAARLKGVDEERFLLSAIAADFEAGINPRKSSLAARPTSPADAIDAAADEMAGEWEPLIGPIVAGLQAEIAAASSLEEVRTLFRARLEGLSSAALGEELARMAFAARLSGETGEELA